MNYERASKAVRIFKKTKTNRNRMLHTNGRDFRFLYDETFFSGSEESDAEFPHSLGGEHTLKLLASCMKAVQERSLSLAQKLNGLGS